MGRRRRRGRRKSLKLKLNKQSSYSISSIILLVSGGITFVSFFAQAASVNSILQDLINRFFGFGAVFVPFILVLAGLVLGRTIKWAFVETRVLAGLITFFLSFISMVHLFYPVESAKRAAQFGDGGGLLGFYIQDLLRNLVTGVGAFLVILAGVIISLILIFDAPPQVLLEALKKAFDFLKEQVLELTERFKKEPEESEEVSEEFEKGESEQPSQTDQTGEGMSEPEKEGLDFEVIPSFSEPVTLGHFGVPKEEKVQLKQETITNLPYTDKVWEYPSLDILQDMPEVSEQDSGVDNKKVAQIIEETLESFGVKAKVAEVNVGPAVTQYALETASGTKIAKITNLQHDLALALASPTGSVRIEAPIPGRSLIGIEVPNPNPTMVNLKGILSSDKIKDAKSKLMLSLGKDVAGNPLASDLARMPHVLVAGSTGSGKSVLLHSFLSTLLFRNSPSELKLILIDPKRVELPRYADIPHLLTPVIVDPERAVPSLRWAISEMDRRYRLLENAKARNIASYNEMSGFQALPYIIIIVDELADLMSTAPLDVEKAIIRLAQMSRAVGIHLILATQRPSVDILTGLIKANIPCRIAFNTVSQVDSRVIIDQPGAEKLLGRGDMLYVPPDVSRPIRIQGAFTSDKEVAGLISYLKSTNVAPEYKEEVTEIVERDESVSEPKDELFKDALEIIILEGKASASLLQRKLSIGYARAARIIDEMEAMNIIGKSDGSKPREVLVKDVEQVLGEDEGRSETTTI